MDPRSTQEAPPDAVVQQLLAERAERVREPRVLHEEQRSFPVAEFPVGDERYAIPLAQIHETVVLQGVTPVPLVNPCIVGIFRYHGRIITVLSIASLLGVRGWRTDPAVLLIVDRGGGELVALDCERVPIGISLPIKSVEVARTGTQAADVEILVPDGVVRLLDVPRLISQRLPGR